MERPPSIEENVEIIPTPEEVKDAFEQLTKSGEYETTKLLEDEKGIYKWEIVVQTEEGSTEYAYRRGRVEEEENPGLNIDAYFNDKEGAFIEAEHVAVYKDSKWKLI